MPFTMLLGVMLLLSLPVIEVRRSTVFDPWAIDNGPSDLGTDPFDFNRYLSVQSNVTQGSITVTGVIILTINSGYTLTVTGDLDEAVIYVSTDNSITINDPGTLIAPGGFRSAGIGGRSGSGGTITITGGACGAGIGSGYNSGGNITISGGTVKATGSTPNAGIG